MCSLILTESKKKSDPVPRGLHQVVLFGVVDIGTQKSANPAHPDKRKVVLLFELPHETKVFDGKEERRVINRSFAISLNEKATLFKFLSGWLGEKPKAGFDLRALIGKNGQANVVHSPSQSDPSVVYANLDSVVPLAKGMQAVAPARETITFTIPPGGPIDIPSYMPEWIADKIRASAEFKARTDAAAGVKMGGE
jgi:hypothetical protein